MYQAQSKRRSGKLWGFLIFLSVLAVGFGIGFAAMKSKLLPSKNPTNPQDLSSAVSSQTPRESKTENAERSVSGSAEMTKETTPSPTSPPKEGYLVQSLDGKVCVFQITADGSTKFSHNIAVELNDLPAADREKLAKGIYAKTKTELAELTEDYSS